MPKIEYVSIMMNDVIFDECVDDASLDKVVKRMKQDKSKEELKAIRSLHRRR